MPKRNRIKKNLEKVLKNTKKPNHIEDDNLVRKNYRRIDEFLRKN